MASVTSAHLERFLEELGCSKEQIEAYLCLISSGEQTVLSLSRKLKTGRTKLYPLLITLAEKQLIVIKERHYGTSYEALPPSSLEYLVGEAERRASLLRSSLPAAEHMLSQLSKGAAPLQTRVKEYRGIEGLKQVNWNLTKAKEKYLVFEQENLERHPNMSFAFVENLRSQWAENRITSYDLTNNPRRECRTKCVKYKKHFSKAAYISPDIFKISFESYIYNSCVTLVKYEEKDIVALEIYSEAFARQQEQLFWLVWKMAKPLI